MLNRLADLIRLRPGLDEAIQRVDPSAPIDLNDLPVGTELQARVTATLPNRVYQVVIGERTYTLPLPIDAQPGDEIQLTVVERDARAATPPAHAPASRDRGTITILSPTARFITSLLNTPNPLLLQRPASPPLLPAPPGAPAAMAERLTQAVVESGMFYESHQAQWVTGERSLAQLMQEPQARIPPLPRPDTSPVAESVETAASSAASAAEACRVDDAPVHPALRPMVRDQLEALSSLRLSWQGQIWPGQGLYWEIEQDAPERGANTETVTGIWQSRLTLKLPSLGDVRAVVSIGAGGVGIRLAAANASTLEALKAGAGSLRSALNRAGLRPASFRIDDAGVKHG